MSGLQRLAAYQRCVQRIRERWPEFLARRDQRLQQQRRYGHAAEKVAEDILADLFTQVLDWSIADLNHQVEYADIELTNHGIKRLLIEVKRPGALAWNRRAVDRALDQACRYADQQRVGCVAVSDGTMLYAADLAHGGLCDRAYVSLAASEPPEELWWLSRHGIYHPRSDGPAAPHPLPAEADDDSPDGAGTGPDVLLHPKYHLPARCFGYVGRADKPATWRLPYRLADGSVDERRLPKAIQAVLSNYRGAQVTTIPEPDIPAVLRRLAEAAESIGRLPITADDGALAYRLLVEALAQLDR